MPERLSAIAALSGVEFVAQLRSATKHYIATVDAWELDYAKFYRLPDRNRVSSDLEPANHDYIRARQELLEFLPRAKRLCLKYELSDPWPGILRIDLGSQAPQSASGPAIGRAQRNRISDCLDRMEEGEWEPAQSPPEQIPSEITGQSRGVLRRILDFFF